AQRTTPLPAFCVARSLPKLIRLVLRVMAAYSEPRASELQRFVTLQLGEVPRIGSCGPIYTAFHDESAWPRFCYGPALCERPCRERGRNFDGHNLVSGGISRASGVGQLSLSRSSRPFRPRSPGFATSTT